jgi:predicted MFS family arabinose efflux permease
VAAIGLIALLADWYLVPANLPQPAPLKSGSIRRLFQVPSLRANMVLTALAFGASFPIYTYLSAILKNQHWSTTMSVYILIGYGLMVAIGNTIGGRLANSQPLQALQRVLWVELGVLIIVSLTITQHWFGLIALLGLGLFGFMSVPALQLKMLQTAEHELPADINMASALNVASFNVGITVGSLSGGYLVSAFGVPSTPIASLIIISLALMLIWRMKKS